MDTLAHCTGAASPPESAVWLQRREPLQEEPWARCWQEPGPDSTRPPGGCCQWPGREDTGQEGLLRPDTLHSDVGAHADQLKAARKAG